MNLEILFLQYYLAVMSEYEYRSKELRRRLSLKYVSNSDLIDYIILIGEQRGFQKCYNDLYKFVQGA